MSRKVYLLKRRRYDGTETVVTRYWDREEAQDDADVLNTAYQSGQYYVEPYDPAKAAGFVDDKLVNEMAQRVRGV